MFALSDSNYLIKIIKKEKRRSVYNMLLVLSEPKRGKCIVQHEKNHFFSNEEEMLEVVFL